MSNACAIGLGSEDRIYSEIRHGSDRNVVNNPVISSRRLVIYRLREF